jgi:hypothetical protein
MWTRIFVNELMAGWYYSVIPALVVALTNLTGTLKLRSTLNTLGSIKSPADLPIVRNAINLNMTFATAILGEGVLYAVMLLCLVFGQLLRIDLALSHLAVFGCLIFIPGLCAMKVERRFRRMPVTASDPSVALTFAGWIKQWRGVGLQLHD